MRNRTSYLLVIPVVIMASLSLLSACGEDGDSWVSESIDPDNVRVVENGPYPREWTGQLPIMRLEDEVVIGEGREDESYLFSAQTTGGLVAGGPNGQVGYTELQPPELRVFRPDGEFLWKAGRSGEGPGEFRFPNRPAFVPSIGWIVNAPTLNRLIVFREDGSFSRNRPLDQVPWAQHFSKMEFCPNGDFWLLAHRSRSSENGMNTAYYVVWVGWEDFRFSEADSFEHVSTVKSNRYTYMYQENPVNLAVDDRGRAWVNGVFPYQIDVFGLEAEDHWRALLTLAPESDRREAVAPRTVEEVFGDIT